MAWNGLLNRKDLMRKLFGIWITLEVHPDIRRAIRAVEWGRYLADQTGFWGRPIG